MICIFTSDKVSPGDEKAAAVKGLKAFKRNANVDGIKEKEEEALNEKLSALEEVMDDDETDVKDEIIKGVPFTAGVNGISYVKSPRRSFECSKSGIQEGTKGRISCYFSGDLNQKHINEISVDRHLRDDSDCQKIIQLYTNATVMNALGEFAVGGGFGPIFRNALKSSIVGSYAFILYDRSLKRIVAGRSPDGAEPLFWAAGTDKKSLMFSSNRLALFKDGEAVTEFPKGAVYVSNPGDLVGSLNAKKYTGVREMMFPSAPSRRRASCVLHLASAMEGIDASETKETADPVPLRTRRAATETGAKMLQPPASPFASYRSSRQSVELLG